MVPQTVDGCRNAAGTERRVGRSEGGGVQWCEQVQRLCEVPSRNGPESLTARLEAIGEGLRLRRRLDGLTPDEPIVSSRLAVLRSLTVLQQLAAEELGLWTRVLLAAAKSRPGSRSGCSRRGPPSVTYRNGFRLSLCIRPWRSRGCEPIWNGLSVLVARLDQETPNPPTAWLDVELERLRGSLCPSADRQSDPRDRSLYAACEQTQAIVLDRRVRHELTRPVAGLSAEELWTHRFQLSRLPGTGGEPGPGLPVEGHSVRARRGPRPVARSPWNAAEPELAVASDDAVFHDGRRRPPRAVHPDRPDGRSTKPARRSPSWKGCRSPARSSDSNMVRDGLETLVGSCRRVVAPAGPPDAAESLTEPSGVPSRMTRLRRTGFSKSHLGRTGDDPDHEAAKQLRRQSPRRRALIETGARRVAGESVVPADGAALGTADVAVLENTVPGLDPGADRSDRGRDHGGTCVAQRAFRRPAPALRLGRPGDLLGVSLRVHLKLILAPSDDLFPPPPGDRLRRLVAVRFSAHSIDLAQMQTAVGLEHNPAALSDSSRFGRLARVVRLFRVALPFIRLMRRVAYPSEVQRSPGPSPGRATQPQHHPFRAVASAEGRVERSPSSAHTPERAGASENRVEPRLDRDQRRLLATGSWAIWTAGSAACRRGDRGVGRGWSRARDPRRGGGGTPDPDDARTAPRPDGAGVRDLSRPLSPVARPAFDPPLPGFQTLVAYREKSPAESVALAPTTWVIWSSEP